MSRAETDLRRFDPLDERVVLDPYPLYHRYRVADPVHEGAPPFPSVHRCYYLFRHDDVLAVLVDRRFGRTRPGGEGREPVEPRWVRRLGRSMVLFNDPPEQVRIRGLMAAAFSPAFIEGLRPRVEAVATRLVKAVPRREPFNFVDAVAEPLPGLVIAGALGLPDEDYEQIRDWSSHIIGITDPRGTDVAVGEAAQAARELLRYLKDRLRERRRKPGDDLMSGMLAARRNGDRLTDDEVLANSMFLLSAGHETTAGLLGNGMLALLQNPDEWRRLLADPALIVPATEELLRYDSPIQMTFRFAREPVDIGGHTVGVGEAVAAMVGAANRDPEVFSDPDRLDLDRAAGRHLAFSAGTHFCMGPTLARMEAQEALKAVAETVPDLTLAGRPARRAMVSFRKLQSLPVATSGGS